jgi:hypothetical protein
MQVRKTCAVGVELEERASGPAATTSTSFH